MSSLAFAMVVCFLLSAGVAPAGEESYLAMRGQPPAGVAAVNQVTSVRLDAGVEVSAPSLSRSVRLAGSGMGFSPKLDFVGWKAALSRTCLPLPDQAVEWSGGIDFGSAPRFVSSRAESDEGSFISLFLRELGAFGGNGP